MKERGMIFNGEMVRAILDGYKTQTRRPVKLKEFGISTTLGYRYQFRDRRYLWNDVNEPRLVGKFSPYGAPGDRIYVRETWTVLQFLDSDNKHIAYKADEINSHNWQVEKWHPSIHMPKWAARIWLEITDVRVERVQEISEDDAIAEGCAGFYCDCKKYGRGEHGCTDCYNTGWSEPPQLDFMYVWNSIYNNWDDNPWVWVYEFKVIEK